MDNSVVSSSVGDFSRNSFVFFMQSLVSRQRCLSPKMQALIRPHSRRSLRNKRWRYLIDRLLKQSGFKVMV